MFLPFHCFLHRNWQFDKAANKNVHSGQTRWFGRSGRSSAKSKKTRITSCFLSVVQLLNQIQIKAQSKQTAVEEVVGVAGWVLAIPHLCASAGAPSGGNSLCKLWCNLKEEEKENERDGESGWWRRTGNQSAICPVKNTLKMAGQYLHNSSASRPARACLIGQRASGGKPGVQGC